MQSLTVIENRKKVSQMFDTKNAIEHLRMHQKYPATREKLIEECDNLSDFSEADKEWFKAHLKAGTYNSADEVIMALGLDQHAGKTM